MAGLVPNVYAATSITLAAATAALVLRLCARRMTRMRLWFGQTLAPFDEQQAEHIREKSRLLLWSGGIIYASSIAASKLSILSMYWRLFQFTSSRYPILILIVLSSVWYTIRTFMVIFQCVPVQAYWDKSIDDAKCRINGAKFFLGTVLTHSLMDLMILTLPITEVSRMHLPLGQKLAVVGLFAAGSMVFIASVVIVVQSAKFDPKSTELPYDVCYNVMAAVVEVNLAVFSGCLPILRPIFRKVVAGLSSGASKHGISLPSRHPPS
ncbi:hypothetical protein AK830_g7216 [Neonectria ditissima]|uniref:Rhodopsin domain-containing protein n=1 Tax=Neonectria ditissima TaxID=78410 RepID=A0A0P7BEM3_9HYPO|nr:hypothetical protein AK830_g7216 [Neonectria ditissima]